ncbi:molybdopterin-dependent oxidoreductase [Nonomuraea phyllanthi]|uniref:xanthine dehydrogenase family protein molybdopterin-binding subunit n=1 Tax=Nonomuraea phyllanthi TaxID=2219224 RepID=UPI001293CAAB|nr:xanthine dehydrogenase family protein molybdopterin-binding subunit [Nonomuraea phyllanthi]QFY11262.1 molybdopterin-dependent oxidoreductase [Nonomuraea phyllanthi]
MRYIGMPLARREDRDLVTGRAPRVADLELPGTLELAFTRAPVPHARIRGVDVAAALKEDGVAGAWSAAGLPYLAAREVPGRQGGPPWPLLATGRVRHPGEALAVVAADTRAHAEDGAEAVRLDLEPLPFTLAPGQPAADRGGAGRLPAAPGAAAGTSGPPRLFEDRDNVVVDATFGAPADDVFATAPVVVEAAYREQLLLPTSLEPRAVLVDPGRDGRLTVWVSHQAQHRLRTALATALGLDQDRVRVIVPATGGAFGAKSQTYPEYLVAALLAVHLRRPVRWCEDRAEAMLAGPRGRGQAQRVRLAADEDGTFLAYELLVEAGIGAYPHIGSFVPMMTGAMSTGAYRTPRVHTRVRCVLTNTAPTTSYRGAGRPEAAYALERTVDRLARRLGMDPAELRRRNLIRPDQFPYRTPTGRTYDSGDYAAALAKALAAVGYDELRAEQARRRADGGPPLGVGIATYVERSGGPPDSDEFGSVEACPDGGFIARVGSTSTGQGHFTAFAQVVASVLDVEVNRVRVVEGDTGEVPYGYATFGSRSMQVGGAALWRAAEALVAAARRRCAGLLGVGEEEVAYAAGRLVVGGTAPGALQCDTEHVPEPPAAPEPPRTPAATAPGAEASGVAAGPLPGLPIGELVARTGPLRADEIAAPPQAFPYGTHVAVVEVDPDLGTVHVRRLVAVDDYGVVVNPMIVDGQGYGSIAQGLGQALYEQAVIGGDGLPYASTLLDYLLPTSADMPPITLLETATPNPNTPLGAKGAGEAGCIGIPPAIVNAVCDALDLDHIDMPLTPAAVWSALHPE